MMRNYPDEMTRIKTLAGVDFLDVCLLGETGTGKTYLARQIHEMSPRANKPFVAVNCAELSPTIIEAELFGYEKGAFTGAFLAKAGLFEAAIGGTLFLDEIGELPFNLQAKLLKVVEEKTVKRVGATCSRPINVRIIYATHRDPDVLRQDLRYRIAAHTITLKPLRDRPGDIINLTRQFIADFCHKTGQRISIDENALRILARAEWKGNIRELRAFIENICLNLISDDNSDEPTGESKSITVLTAKMLIPFIPQIHPPFEKLIKPELNNSPASSVSNYRNDFKSFERNLIEMTLTKNNGNVSRSAVELSLSRYGLIKKIKSFGIVIDK